MDKLEKFLRKLSTKEREALELVLAQLLKNYRVVPGIKKIVNRKNLYRLRVGRVRVLFQVDSKQKITIRKIGFRDSKTYSEL